MSARKLSSETRAKNSERATEWNRANLRRYTFTFHIDTESELIEWMERQPSKQAYLKQLILKDMQNSLDKG